MSPKDRKDPPGTKPDNSQKPKQPKPAKGPEPVPDLIGAGKRKR